MAWTRGPWPSRRFCRAGVVACSTTPELGCRGTTSLPHVVDERLQGEKRLTGLAEQIEGYEAESYVWMAPRHLVRLGAGLQPSGDAAGEEPEFECLPRNRE